MTKLSILNVAYPFAPVGRDTVGGAEQVLTSIDRYLHAQGHRSVVLACEGSSAHGALNTAPLPAGALDENARRIAREHYRAQLHALVEQHEFDLVHMHGVDFADYLPPADVPTLVTLHLPITFYDTRALATLPPHVQLCCVSEAQRARAPSELKLLPDVPNGVPLEALATSESRDDYLLVLSRICPEKGVHLALDVAHRLELPAIIAGRVYPYPEHERYFAEQVAPRLDAERRYVGPVAMPEKAQLLARARCLMVPSLVDETSSLVSMEALACGTPVVALRRGALPRVVEHGVTGFVVDDFEQLVHAVRTVATISRESCRRAAEERFSERAMCERYLSLYRDLPRRSSAVRNDRHIDVQEVNTLDGLRELASEWRSLWERCPSSTFFQRPEWLLPFVQHLLRGELRTLTLRRRGELVGLWPMFTWQRDQRHVLSLLGAGVSDYQTVLFDLPHERACREAFARWLAESDVGACEWSELLPDSPLLSAPFSCARGDESEAQEVCPAIVLGSAVEERSLAPHLSSKLRHNLATSRRNAERAGFTFEAVQAATLEEFLERLWVLHTRRREQLGGEGCFAVTEQRAFYEASARALFESNLLRMYGLRSADGQLGAVIEAVRERGSLRLYQHGFDPALSRYSPGAISIEHAVERAIEEGATIIDFLRGDEPYKYRWGCRDRLRISRRSLSLADG